MEFEIPDWWRCRNCKWYIGDKREGRCSNLAVKKSIITQIEGEGSNWGIANISLRFRPGFGCRFFKEKR